MRYFKVLNPDRTNIGLLKARIIKYQVREWTYPGENLSSHPRKGGGLWVVKNLSAAKKTQKYLKGEYQRGSDIWECKIGKIIYDASQDKPTSARIKTDRVMLLKKIL